MSQRTLPDSTGPAARPRAARVARGPLLAALLALASGCAKFRPAAPATPDGPRYLRYVPADTPYAFATLRPLDPSYSERALSKVRQVESALAVFERELADEIARLPRPLRLAFAALREMRGKLHPEGLASLGMSMNAGAVLYGIGVVPVLRWELTDASRFRAFVERTLSRARAYVPVGAVQGQPYWYATSQAGVRLIAAVVEHTRPDDGPPWGELVLTIDHDDLAGATLPLALGVVRPERSLADTGALQAIAAERGLDGSGAGFVDFGALADIVLGRATGDGAAAAGLDLAPSEPACARAVDAAAEAVPRLVFGTRTVSASLVHFAAWLELRADVAAAIERVQAWAPGRAVRDTHRAVLSAAVDIGGLADLWDEQLAGSPVFRCSRLAGLAAARDYVGGVLAAIKRSPAGSITGGTIAVRAVTFAGGVPTGIDASVLLGTTAPAQVAAMLGQLAGVETKGMVPGGAPAPVELPAGLEAFGPVVAALGDAVVGAAVGADAESLPGAVSEPAGRSSLLSFHIDGALQRQLDALDGDGLAAPDGASPALAAALRRLEAAQASTFASVSGSLSATSRGLELEIRTFYDR